MNLARGCALAAGLALLGGGLWHLAHGGSARRIAAQPESGAEFRPPEATLRPSQTSPQPVLPADSVALSEATAPSPMEPVQRTSVPLEPTTGESEVPDAELQLDLGLVNPGSVPVATDRSALARDWAPRLAAELGWALADNEVQLLGTWLAGHERRERRLLEAELSQSAAADQARVELQRWFESFDALFGEQRGLALRQRLEQR